ncbi:hypothetical protein [Nostoc sp. PA-18-2419]|uniref:hypothetical protein n=1 Tax=Nostoc sp. PA-18-2419 TaxID=2575443 RepID=UPI001678A028|nr:hypothetical protein [Nostoc sp. PA-18-2419]
MVSTFNLCAGGQLQLNYVRILWMGSGHWGSFNFNQSPINHFLAVPKVEPPG